MDKETKQLIIMVGLQLFLFSASIIWLFSSLDSIATKWCAAETVESTFCRMIKK